MNQVVICLYQEMVYIICLNFFLQDPKDLQLEPDVSKLKSMKRSVLGRRVVNKIKRPEKIVPTIGGYFRFGLVFSFYSLSVSVIC